MNRVEDEGEERASSSKQRSVGNDEEANAANTNKKRCCACLDLSEPLSVISEKEKNQKKFEPTYSHRKCTDVYCLVALILYW